MTCTFKDQSGDGITADLLLLHTPSSQSVSHGGRLFVFGGFAVSQRPRQR